GPAATDGQWHCAESALWDNLFMTARLFWILVGLGALCAALAGFLLAAQIGSSHPVLASGTWLTQARPVAEFHLIDSTGHPFTRASLLGHPTLVYFGFTHCPDECPDTLAALARVEKQARLPGLQVLFVTVDPQRDTPAVLAGYLRQFDPSFVGLTGSPAEIQRFASSLGIGVTRINLPGGGYDFDHTMAILLFDSGAREVGVFTPPFDARQLARSLRGVAPELRTAA
ncbi:MAG TPA: SCO family protein, partial [Steroidobacteraceae bacterium]